MTKLFFRYSYIYEKLLSKLSGDDFTWDNYKSGLEFTNRFSEFWNQYNDKVFSFYQKYNLTLADFWIVYFVRAKKNLTPFSDPLTVFINDDFKELMEIIIHELCHVLQTYPSNMKLQDKLYDHVTKIYPDNPFDLNAEIITAILTRPCLIEILGLEEAEQILQKEKDLPLLGQAWKIIDSQPNVLNEKDPVKAVFKLA